MTARSLRLLLVLVAVLLLAVLAFQFLFDPVQFKRLLIEQVEEQIGRKMEVGEARLQLFPRIRLDLTDVVIRDLDPSRVFFKAKRFHLVLRSTPLLQWRVVVKRIHVEEPEIALHRNKAGQWNYSSAARSGGVPGEDGTRNPLAVLMAIQETVLLDGDLVVSDEFRPDGLRSIRVHVSDAKMTTGVKGVLADINVNGTLPAEHGASSLSVIGQLNHATPSVGPRAPDITADTRVQFQGEAALLNVDIRQIAEFFGPRPVPERLHSSVNLRGKISLAPGVMGYDLVLSNMRADMGHLVLSGQAGISGMLTAQPTYALTFSSTPMSLDELLTRFPVQWFAPQLQAVIAEQEIRGVVEAVTATLAGTAGPNARPSFTGEFRVHDGHALIGKDKTSIEGLAAKVLVESDRIRITGISGLYGPMRVAGGKATLSFPEAGPWLELEIPGEIPAPDLVVWLTRNIKVAGLVRSLAELRDVQGDAVLTVKLAGSLRSSEGLRFQGGELEGRNLGFRSPQLPEPVDHVTGRLQFSPTGFVFRQVQGRMGASRMEIDGVIMSDGETAYDEFVVKVQAEAAQINRLLPEGTFKPGDFAGMVEGVVTLSGPTDTPTIKSRLDLKETTLHLAGLVRKAPGTPGSFVLEGALGANERLTVSRMQLLLPPFHIDGKGRLRLGKKFSLDMALGAQPIALAELPKGLAVGGLDAGTLEVSLDIKGRGTNWKAWQFTGWVALTDGQLSLKGLDSPLREVYLRLQLVKNGAEVKRLSFKLKDSDIRLFGAIKNWSDPVIEAKAEGSHFDLALVIPEGERSPVRAMLEDLAATTHITLTANADRGVYKNLSFSALSARIGIGNGLVTVDNLDGEAEGGHISGSLKVRLPQQKPSEFETSFRLGDVPYNKLLYLSGNRNQLITGNLTTSVALKFNGRDPKGEWHSLNGQVNVVIKQGHIQRGTVVPKILKILNLPALLQGKVDLANEGLPFDRISGNFKITDGLVTTENLLVDSPILKLTGVGSYNIPADQLDAVMVASPLGSYSKLLQSIPLFGKLLAGERKGFTTAFFEIKGSLKDPNVRYLPFEALKSGITGTARLAFDVLKNAILLPKELISPTEEEEAPSSEPEPAKHPESRDEPEPPAAAPATPPAASPTVPPPAVPAPSSAPPAVPAPAPSQP